MNYGKGQPENKSVKTGMKAECPYEYNKAPSKITKISKSSPTKGGKRGKEY